MQGFGTAIYVNHPYEFVERDPKTRYPKIEQPYLPEDNPVGVYRREIDIPESWSDREIFLSLDGGAKSGVYVYINGKEVGYSEDSKTAAEFRINKYVKPGKKHDCSEIIPLEYRILPRMPGLLAYERYRKGCISMVATQNFSPRLQN